MEVIPALYLVDGKCVSVYKGDVANTTVYSANPLYDARHFEKQKAKSILIMDGNGDIEGSKKNSAITLQVAKNTKLNVIFADGVSTIEEAEELFNAGVKIILLGESARSFLPEAVEKYGAEKIWFLIRADRSFVEGLNNIDVVDYAREVVKSGVSTLVFWDIKSEGTLHPNFDEVDRLVLSAGAKIIAFGGVGSVSDVRLLEKTGAEAVIISRALFENKISMSDF